jgi:hypothetical protein
VRRGRIDLLREAIKAGADINARCRSFGKTPLIELAVRGEARACRTLLQANADVNAVGRAQPR